MKTITLDLYKFSELSENAKQTAIEDYRGEGHENHSAGENSKTLEEFEHRFPIIIRNWCYGGRGEGVSFDMEQQLKELTGIRLMAYLYNNHFNDLFSGKYYSLWSKTDINPHYTEGGHAPKGALKDRHSKVMFDTSCPLTGYCMDDDILDPIYKFLRGEDLTLTFEELIQDCFHSWIRACNNDVEHQNSDEYISENLEINEYDFTENGKQY